MIALSLVIVALHFTTPNRDACEAGCEPCSEWTMPVEVALVNAHGDTLDRHPVSAPGAQDSLAFEWGGETITLYAISRKAGGPWSCQSNPVQFGTVSVPITESEAARTGYYDLVGRRAYPGASGVYFERRKNMTRKIVVVR